MYFYKYNSVSPLSLMMLKRGEIYFASSEELNDTHECRARYLFGGSKDVWIRFIDYVLINIAIECRLNPSSEQAKNFISLADVIYSASIKIKRRKYFNIDELEKLITLSLVEHISVELRDIYKENIFKNIQRLFKSIKHNNLREQKYISSFSLNATNPTMWGHYANAEKGFLVIYESDEQSVKVNSTLSNLSGHREKSGFTELGHYDNESLNLKEVKYRKLPCKVNGFSRLIHKFRYSEMEYHYDVPESFYGEIDSLEEDLVGLVKYTDWKYEKEVRLLFPTYEKIPSELRCLQVDFKHIKGIVFGANTSRADKDKIIMACFHLYKVSKSTLDFIFLQAKESAEMYEIEIVPVGVLATEIIIERLPLKLFHDITQQQKQAISEMCIEISKVS